MAKLNGALGLSALLLGLGLSGCDGGADVGSAGDGGSPACEPLQQELSAMVSVPRIAWNKEAYDLQERMKGLGCTPQLGETPFYCNKGVPKCPDGYSCEEDQGFDVCSRVVPQTCVPGGCPDGYSCVDQDGIKICKRS